MQELQQKDAQLVPLFLALISLVITGVILVIGESFLLPVVIAGISACVLVAFSQWLENIALFRSMPKWFSRVITLLIFLLIFGVIATTFLTTAQEVIGRIPTYQENLVRVSMETLTRLGIQRQPNWEALIREGTKQIDFRNMVLFGLGSLGSLLSLIGLVAIYTVFIIGEIKSIRGKVRIAFDPTCAKKIVNALNDIYDTVINYVTIKTVINFIQSIIFYIILKLFNVEFALFWAIFVGIANYVPYVGALLGVFLPAILSLAQFGDFQKTFAIALLLALVQLWISNALEPRLIGQKVNMSPFFVLIALAFWSTIWGVPGAVLAIPLTSMFLVVFSRFNATKPLSVLAAGDPSSFYHDERQSKE